MNKEELLELKKKIASLSENEKKARDLYLKKIATGEIQGPKTGYPSIDKPWLKYYSDEEVVIDFPNMSMKEYLVERNKNNLNNIAINYYGRKISYQELIDKIEEAKRCFSNIGVKDGDVVSVASPFLPEIVYSIYALNALGAVVNLIDPRVPSDKFLDYFKGSNTKYLVAYNACYKKIKDIEKDSNIKKTILISATDSLPFGIKVIGKLKEYITTPEKIEENEVYTNWNNFIKNNRDNTNVKDAIYQKNKPAIIVYTSGTSGEPKGAISSNESYNNIACSQDKSLYATKLGDKFLLIMPPFIAYGLAIGMHGQLCRGQELIMVPSFNIENQKEMLGDLVAKYHPQTIMGVPTFMSDLIEHPKMQNMDLSFLKAVIVGGDSMIPSSEELVDSFLEARKSEARICKGWGLTEVNSAFSYTKDRANNEIGSVGIPLLGNNIKVVKPVASDDINFNELEEVSYNETGEIFINSKSIIMDYLNNEEESKRVFFTSKEDNETWVRTKDLGRVTEDGIIYIEGRMKRIIIRSDGHNISPFAIENIINKNEMVESCAVVGRPNVFGHGAVAIAYVQIKDEYRQYEESIINNLKIEVEKKLPPRDIASEYKVIDEMPLTNIGKVDYKFLEEKEKKLVLKR